MGMHAEILHLAPNDPDVKVFTDFAKTAGTTSATTTATTTTAPATTGTNLDITEIIYINDTYALIKSI